MPKMKNGDKVSYQGVRGYVFLVGFRGLDGIDYGVVQAPGGHSEPVATPMTDLVKEK